MKDHLVTTIIDSARCDGCRLCVKLCPDRTISISENKAAVTGNRCMACGHCAAVCPNNAIEVHALDPNTFDFQSFNEDDRWLPHGQFDTAQLVRLMRSRRSCRNFHKQTVSRQVLYDLVKIGITAPSGTNSQKWMFTILPSRSAVLKFGQAIADFFRRINKTAEKVWLRKGLKLLGKNKLDFYYNQYHATVKSALTEWDADRTDRLFHGAPSVIIVGSRPGASCPMEDAILATQNMLLAAHSLGLGTCLVGYAVAAMQQEASLQQKIGIPKDETVYAVIAVGYPDEIYQRPAGRKKVVPRIYME